MLDCAVRREEGSEIKPAVPQCLLDRDNVMRLLEELVSTTTARLARLLAH